MKRLHFLFIAIAFLVTSIDSIYAVSRGSFFKTAVGNRMQRRAAKPPAERYRSVATSAEKRHQEQLKVLRRKLVNLEARTKRAEQRARAVSTQGDGAVGAEKEVLSPEEQKENEELVNSCKLLCSELGLDDGSIQWDALYNILVMGSRANCKPCTTFSILVLQKNINAILTKVCALQVQAQNIQDAAAAFTGGNPATRVMTQADFTAGTVSIDGVSLDPDGNPYVAGVYCLGENVTSAFDPAIDISIDNVKINLKCFTIEGTGAATQTGILTSASRTQVIDGNLDDFGTGIMVDGSTPVTDFSASGVNITDSTDAAGAGVDIDGTGGSVDGVNMDNIMVRGGIGDGVRFTDATHVDYSESQVYGVSGDGINATGSTELCLSKLCVADAGGDSLELSGVTGAQVSELTAASSGGDGVKIDDTTEASFSKATISNPTAAGVRISGTSENIDIDSASVQSAGGAGVLVESDAATAPTNVSISNSTVTGSVESGFQVGSGLAVDPSNVLFYSNTGIGNATGGAPHQNFYDEAADTSRGNSFVNNKAIGTRNYNTTDTGSFFETGTNPPAMDVVAGVAWFDNAGVTGL